jgi:hypothetical protein
MSNELSPTKDKTIQRLENWLERGMDINQIDPKGYTKLHYAVIHEQDQILAFLLEKGADPSISTASGCTAIRLAEYLGKKQSLKLLAPMAPTHSIQFCDKKNQSKQELSVAELEKQIPFIYSTSLQFESLETLNLLQKIASLSDCKKMQERSASSSNEKLLRSIQKPDFSSILRKISIEWVSDDMGFGLFARSAIPSGTYIGEYTGKVRREKTTFSNSYSFFYASDPIEEGYSYFVDALSEGSYTRFINHSDEPNVSPYLVYYDGLLHQALISTRNIPIGEQIFYDYGPYFWKTQTKD